MSDTNKNTAAGGATTPTTEEKTFTQAQLDAIVGKRLAEDRAKAEAGALQREQDLARREFMLNARETLAAKGLPSTLLDSLNTTSPEAFEASVAAIEGLTKEREQKAFRERPPVYAAGTGSNPMLGDGRSEAVRQAMGLSKKE